MVEIYHNDGPDRCTICGRGEHEEWFADLPDALVCEDCIQHPELVDERLDKRAAGFERHPANSLCSRHAAGLRDLIGKLKLPTLADYLCAVRRREEEDARADAELARAEDPNFMPDDAA